MTSRTWARAWATTMNTTWIYQILTQSQAQALSSMMIMTTSVNHAVRTTCLQMPLLFQHQQHLISHHQLLSPQYQKLSPLGYSMHWSHAHVPVEAQVSSIDLINWRMTTWHSSLISLPWRCIAQWHKARSKIWSSGPTHGIVVHRNDQSWMWMWDV